MGWEVGYFNSASTVSIFIFAVSSWTVIPSLCHGTVYCIVSYLGPSDVPARVRDVLTVTPDGSFRKRLFMFRKK